jgi:hypothetical protein
MKKETSAGGLVNSTINASSSKTALIRGVDNCVTLPFCDVANGNSNYGTRG